MLSRSLLSTEPRCSPLTAADYADGGLTIDVKAVVIDDQYADVVDALRRCRTRSDVRDLRNRRGIDTVQAAWRQLDPVTKASLLLTKQFDGEVIQP